MSIEERRKILLQSEIYGSLFEHHTDVILILDLAGFIIDINEAGLTLLNQNKNQLYLQSITTHLHFSHTRKFLETLNSMETESFNAFLNTRNSSRLMQVELTSIPIVLSGKVEGRFIQGRDLTGEIEVVNELKTEYASFWESFIHHSTDAVGLYDLEGNIIKLNKATEKIFGYSQEELLGNKVITIPDESYRQEVEYLQQQAISGKTIVEYETIRKKKDGTLITVAITYSPIYNHKGRVIAMANILRDNTSRKEADQELRKSEAKYRLIAENTADMIRVLDIDGTLTFASPSHQWILGRKADTYEKKGHSQYIHPHDIPNLSQQLKEMKKTKRSVNLEYRERHSNGAWISLEAHCTPVTSANGKIDSIVMVIRDLTERKQTEELLRNSDKLAVIGQMAASIAHEIRNPLTSLKGFLNYFQSNSNSNAQRYYDLMLSELDRINLIVSEFLLLAKPQIIKLQKTSVPKLLTHILALVETQMKTEGIHIVTDFEAEIPFIEGDENQLKQVFLNYLKNAIEASTTGGKIKVRVQKEGHYLKVEILDNGHGIPEDQLDKIGRPFYTTKKNGTGLGLMISKKIILNHKGTVSFQSREKEGTSVQVKLPY